MLRNIYSKYLASYGLLSHNRLNKHIFESMVYSFAEKALLP